MIFFSPKFLKSETPSSLGRRTNNSLTRIISGAVLIGCGFGLLSSVLIGQEKTASETAVSADANPFGEDEKDSGQNDRFGLDGDKANGPEMSVGGVTSLTDSKAKTFKNRQGEDVPLIDDMGKVVYKRPIDKDPAEMTEEDFYKTVTPAENVILSKNPTSGPALLEAAVMISRIGRPEFAKLLTEQALTAPGTPGEFAAMIDRLGEDKLIRFARNEIIGEVAVKGVELAMTEAAKEWQTPEFVQAAFDKTFSPSSEVRTAAILDLRKGKTTAFEFLIAELDSGDSARREQAETVLSRLGSFTSEGILVRLRHSDGALRDRLIDVIARMKNLPDLTPLLVLYYDEATPPETRSRLEKAISAQAGTIPSREEGARAAYEKGLGYFQRKIVLPNVADDLFSFWIWNQKGAMERVTLPTDEALRFLAAETLTDAWRLDPNRPEIAQTAVVATAEESVYKTGLDAPILVDDVKATFPGFGAENWEAALAFAMSSDHYKGGIIPAVLLGQTEDASLCVGDAKPSVLVQAATAPDRRLRFAALESIVALSPTIPYAGSSGVTSALVDFTTSLGKRKAIVAIPKPDLIAIAGNDLSDGDLTIVPAQTGGDIIAAAQSDADVEFVMAVSYVKSPDLRTVAQTLKADYRTADIPIMIASEDDTRIHQANRYGEGEKNAYVYILPFDKESGKRGVKELFEKTDPRQVPADIRLARAKEAIRLLKRLRETGGDLYHLENLDTLTARFLMTPTLTWEGVDFALTVPSKSVQVILSQLTFDHRFDADARERYLTALETHVEKFGLLMRGPDILRLFSGPWPGDSGEIRKDFFRLLASHTPEKNEMALSIPSPHIQNLLADLVGDKEIFTEDREEYSALFTRHLAKYGLLLEKPDVKRLYDRYNESEHESEENQKFLAGILDSIELWQSGKLTVR